VLRVVPYAAVHFSLYEQYRRWLAGGPAAGGGSGPVHPIWDLAAGSLSGASAVMVTYPLDLVRTRLAWATEAGGSGGSSSGGQLNIRAVVAKTLQQEGAVGLYRWGPGGRGVPALPLTCTPPA
jgi:solute carrier family 25 protein 16